MNKTITLYIDIEHANEFRMDLIDLAYKPENNVKHSDENKDWHLLLADSIEGQLKAINEKECECYNCTCEETKTDFIMGSTEMPYFDQDTQSIG